MSVSISILNTEVPPSPVKIHQNKWGYYPCSREEFLELKKLHLKCLKALRQGLAHWAWFRKQPKNRKGSAPFYDEVVDAQAGCIQFKAFYHTILKTYQKARKPLPLEEVAPLPPLLPTWKKVIESIKTVPVS